MSNISSTEINLLQYTYKDQIDYEDFQSLNSYLYIKRQNQAADLELKFANANSNLIANFFKAGEVTNVSNYKGNAIDSAYSTNISKGDFLIESWNEGLNKWIYIKLDAANQIVEIPNIKLANETDDLLTMIQKIRVRGLFGY